MQCGIYRNPSFLILANLACAVSALAAVFVVVLPFVRFIEPKLPGYMLATLGAALRSLVGVQRARSGGDSLSRVIRSTLRTKACAGATSLTDSAC